ncbi:MAG TPA: acyl carrier protein [Taishania sp.]|nr:acyl carrier protein [Taishania sp.]
MKKFELLPEFIKFLESELLLDEGEITAESEFRSLRTWSSLNALIIISRINEECDIIVTASDLAKCKTVSELHNLILTK